MKGVLSLLLALLLSGFGLPALQARVVCTQTLPGGVEINVISPFENTPLNRARPLRVEITNPTRETRHWRLEKQHHGGSYQAGFTVEAGQKRSFPLVIPVAPTDSNAYFYFFVFGNEPGLPVSFTLQHQNAGFSGASPKPGMMLAMGRKIGVQTLEPLKNHFDKEIKGCLNATQIDELPEEWRAYEGIDLILMTLDEWNDATPAAQRALRQWVVSGGELALATADPRQIPFPVATGTTAPYGLGRVRHVAYDGKPLPPAPIAQWLAAHSTERSTYSPRPFAPNAEKLGIGVRKVPASLVLVALIVMVGIIGPFNLFWLAPAGRRHRLFVTTPLLSLAGCLFLLVVILLHDGTGGSGQRFSLHCLVPQEPEEVVYQQQLSHTGLILSTGFTLGEAALPSFIFQNHQSDPTLEASGDSLSGTWFRSRCLQAMEIGNVRSTRAALTLTGAAADGAPIVLSSLPAPVETLYLRDREGRYWRGENIRPGEKATLTAAQANACRQWLKEISKTTLYPGNRTTALFNKLPDDQRPDIFYALGPETGPIATLPSIRWKKDLAFHVGTLTRTGEARP